MIAVDTSFMIAYLKGGKGPDVDALHSALTGGNLALPPVVLTELISDPSPPRSFGAILSEIDILPVSDGYWSRAGAARAKLLALGLKTKIADSLIAQSCIDNNVGLMTRDRDFQRFAKHCGLRLA